MAETKRAKAPKVELDIRANGKSAARIVGMSDSGEEKIVEISFITACSVSIPDKLAEKLGRRFNVYPYDETKRGGEYVIDIGPNRETRDAFDEIADGVFEFMRENDSPGEFRRLLSFEQGGKRVSFGYYLPVFTRLSDLFELEITDTLAALAMCGKCGVHDKQAMAARAVFIYMKQKGHPLPALAASAAVTVFDAVAAASEAMLMSAGPHGKTVH